MNFSPSVQKLYGTFEEEITPLGGTMQNIAINAFIGNSTAAAKLLALSKVPGIYIDKNMLMVDLSQMEAIRKYSDILDISFISCNKGYIDFTFTYLGGN